MKGILLNDDYSLMILKQVQDDGLIASGLVIGSIDFQRCRMIIEGQKGEFKEWPTLGFGIDNYLKSVTSQTRQKFITELTKELKSDGMATARVVVGDDLTQFEIEL